MSVPILLRIPYEDREDSWFTDIGRYGDDHQFMAFATEAYPADWWNGNRSPEVLRNQWQEYKRYYAVLHRFDAEGNRLGTEAWSGGAVIHGESEAIRRADAKLNELLASLGPYQHCDIWVKPFGVEIDGYFFGLKYGREEDPDDAEFFVEHVMLEPHDIMFFPPWDSGEYST